MEKDKNLRTLRHVKGILVQKEAIDEIKRSLSLDRSGLKTYRDMNFYFTVQQKPINKSYVQAGPDTYTDIIKGEIDFAFFKKEETPQLFVYEIKSSFENQRSRYESRRQLGIFHFCLFNEGVIPCFSGHKLNFYSFKDFISEFNELSITKSNILTFRYSYEDKTAVPVPIDKYNKGWFSRKCMTQNFFDRYFPS